MWRKRSRFLYVTHSRDEVDALGERVIALEQGRVIGEGNPREVLDAPRRRKLAQAAGFENLLSASVVDLREPDGVMRVRLDESASEIEVPLGYATPGDRVRVAIRAGDILLAIQRPNGLSARNVLKGTIASLERRGNMVIVRVECGVVLHGARDTGRHAGAGTSRRKARLGRAEDAFLPFGQRLRPERIPVSQEPQGPPPTASAWLRSLRHCSRSRAARISLRRRTASRRSA